jgi:hypothetical protein
MAATIKRQIWLANDSGQKTLAEIPARITEVHDGGVVLLRAVSENDRLLVNQDLDPSDRVIMLVEVHGYSGDNEGAEKDAELELDVKDASITPAGGLEVEYRVRVQRHGTSDQLPAKKWGWLLETSPDGAQGKPTLDLIPASGSELTARIPLSGSSLASRVTVRLLGNASSTTSAMRGAVGCADGNPACTSPQFGLWSGLSVWIFVLLGGLLGTSLRWAALATARSSEIAGAVMPPARLRDVPWWIRWFTRHGVELAAGLGTALLLFLMFVTAKPDMFKALDSNAILTRLGVGLVGGVIGASGLAALVQRMIGLKG